MGEAGHDAAAAISQASSIARGRPAFFEARPNTSYVDRPILELETLVRAFWVPRVTGCVASDRIAESKGVFDLDRFKKADGDGSNDQ